MSDKEVKNTMNRFGRGVLKCLGFFGLTSGIGLTVVGGTAFVWSVVMVVMGFLSLWDNAAHYTTYVEIGLLGLISVGIGVMCNELKLIYTK